MASRGRLGAHPCTPAAVGRARGGVKNPSVAHGVFSSIVLNGEALCAPPRTWRSRAGSARRPKRHGHACRGTQAPVDEFAGDRHIRRQGSEAEKLSAKTPTKGPRPRRDTATPRGRPPAQRGPALSFITRAHTFQNATSCVVVKLMRISVQGWRVA